MYKELGMDSRYVEARKANLIYGSDYIELSYYYKKRNQNDLALKVVLDGLNNCDGRLDKIYHYLFQAYEGENNETALWELYQTALKKNRNLDTITELMYGYYKNQHDYDKQKEMLLCMVRCCKREQAMTWYKKCVEELNESDLRIKELEVLSIIKKVNLSTYLDICLEKGNRAEVLEQIQNNRFSLSWNNIDGGHKYSKILAQSHPNEILTLYWKEANDFIRLGKDKNYNHAVSVLKEIQTIMKKSKQTDIWNKQFNELKEHNKRKRNLMKIIEASGIQNR